MNMESIPQESSEWNSLQEDWDRAINALPDDNEMTTELMKVTTGELDDGKAIKNIEKFLKDNFEKLSQADKDFLLMSLRVKNYRRQSESKHP